MTEDLGFSDIYHRAQSDLTERCLHWLETLLRYRLPPARTLELGCAHGAFVFLLKTLGFDAMGLEMSPWVSDQAREFFDVDVLTGPLEDHSEIPDASVDMIFMMDVLEHVHDPIASLASCRRVLKDDGLIFIQTPEAILDESHQQMTLQRPLFSAQLKADEHLHLFTRDSLRECLGCAGFPFLQFEPAIFHFYDMFAIASPAQLPPAIGAERIDAFLTQTPQKRLVKAMIDLRNRELSEMDKLYKECGEAKEECQQLRNALAQLQLQHRQLQEKMERLQARSAASMGQATGIDLVSNEPEPPRSASFFNRIWPKLTSLKKGSHDH